MQHTQILELKIVKWKGKAMTRRQEIHALRRSVSHLRESRDNWKAKAMDHKQSLDERERELKRLGQQIKMYQAQEYSQKPARHCYSLLYSRNFELRAQNDLYLAQISLKTQMKRLSAKSAKSARNQTLNSRDVEYSNHLSDRDAAGRGQQFTR